jgi:hypothetical protein
MLHLAWRKTKWMIITLAIPEFILAKAALDFWSQRLISPKLKELAEKDDVPWTSTHTYLADMGGFRLYFPDADGKWSGRLSATPQSQENASTSKPVEKLRRRYGRTAWAVHPGNLILAGNRYKRFQSDVWVLNGPSLLSAREHEIIETLPAISENEIQHKR